MCSVSSSPWSISFELSICKLGHCAPYTVLHTKKDDGSAKYESYALFCIVKPCDIFDFLKSSQQPTTCMSRCNLVCVLCVQNLSNVLPLSLYFINNFALYRTMSWDLNVSALMLQYSLWQYQISLNRLWLISAIGICLNEHNWLRALIGW